MEDPFAGEWGAAHADALLDGLIADSIGRAEDAGYRAQTCPACEENCGWHKPGKPLECENCGEKFVAQDYGTAKGAET